MELNQEKSAAKFKDRCLLQLLEDFIYIFYGVIMILETSFYMRLT